MAMETKTYYLINRNGTKVAIELLHYTNNKWAAQKALMAAYGLTTSDLTLESGGNPSWARSFPCTTFDGRNAH